MKKIVENSDDEQAGEQVTRPWWRSSPRCRRGCLRPDPTPSRTRSKKSCSWWRAQPEVGEVPLQLAQALVELVAQVVEAGGELLGDQRHEPAISARPVRGPRAWRPRAAPHRSSRSAAGDAAAASSRPMMTGTSTTDSSANSCRRTNRRRRPPAAARTRRRRSAARTGTRCRRTGRGVRATRRDGGDRRGGRRTADHGPTVPSAGRRRRRRRRAARVATPRSPSTARSASASCLGVADDAGGLELVASRWTTAAATAACSAVSRSDGRSTVAGA